VITRRLYRCRDDRKIAGVAAGLAEYFEIDPTVVRVAWVLSILFGGFGIVLYAIMAFVMPIEPLTSATTPAATTAGDTGADGPAGSETAGLETGAIAAPAPTPAHAHSRRAASGEPGRFVLAFGVLLVAFGAIALVGPAFPGWVAGIHLGPAFVVALGIALIFGATRRAATDR
jgi:phage shock protein PspC (stress-responsive transcriptional regulator)